MNGITHRITTKITTVTTMPIVPSPSEEKMDCGRPAMMFAKMMSDMPLPMPRCVMSSPIHMMSIEPAVSVPTTMMSKMTSGAPASAKLMP